MKENEIIHAIGNEIKTYSVWTIGTTDNPDQKKEEHSDPKHLYYWRADTETDAKNVEKYFLERGMHSTPDWNEHPIFAYIFLSIK